MGIHPERSVPELVNPAYMKAYKKGYSIESAAGLRERRDAMGR